ncbi:hypothetical protein BN903_116 [Halorubrum sp. AJ67]|nr:hypothetical protein BN903_116 [Halorubrum sp. AJ67]
MLGPIVRGYQRTDLWHTARPFPALADKYTATTPAFGPHSGINECILNPDTRPHRDRRDENRSGVRRSRSTEP